MGWLCLLVGLKLGHETSIGVNAYHYPGGNELLSQSAANDPARGLKNKDVLARGVAQLGYAALRTSGLRTHGTPTESELRDVAQCYLEMLCHEAAACGVPRERLFAHGAGWKDGELIYDVPVNRFSCPGWSFYQHAADPRKDTVHPFPLVSWSVVSNLSFLLSQFLLLPRSAFSRSHKETRKKLVQTRSRKTDVKMKGSISGPSPSGKGRK